MQHTHSQLSCSLQSASDPHSASGVWSSDAVAGRRAAENASNAGPAAGEKDSIEGQVRESQSRADMTLFTYL